MSDRQLTPKEKIDLIKKLDILLGSYGLESVIYNVKVQVRSDFKLEEVRSNSTGSDHVIVADSYFSGMDSHADALKGHE